MTRRTQGSMMVCAAVAALAVAGCGSSGKSNGGDSGYASKPASTILSDVVSATRSADSFQLNGTLTSSGQSMQADLTFKVPSSLEADVTMGANLIKLIVLPNASYIFANTAFWKKEASSLTAAELSEFANHWFKAPASMTSSLTSQFKDITPSSLSSCISQTVKNPSVAGTSTINGQPTVEVKTNNGAAELFVSTAAPHYLVRLTQSGKGLNGASCGGDDSSSTGSLTFANWNNATVSAPPNAKPLP